MISADKCATKYNQIVVYPFELVEVDRKIGQIERGISKIINDVQQDQKQLNAGDDIQQSKQKQKTNNNRHQNQNSILVSWRKEDEIDRLHKLTQEKNIKFYEAKLEQVKTKCIQLKCQNEMVIETQDGEIKRLKQIIGNLDRQLVQSKQKVKKMQEEYDEAKSIQKMQKQKTTEMLMKQKLDIFQKYSQIQQENIVILKFTEKIEEILKKRSEERDDEKMSSIKEIQLQASKYYSKIHNPMVQDILNSFIQAISLINKKNEKSDEKYASRITEKSNRGLSVKRPVLCLKPNPKEQNFGAQNFEINYLTDDFKKKEKSYLDKIEDMEGVLNFEKEITVTLKKKLQKLQEEVEQRNKQVQFFQHKQEDAQKKIKKLSQNLLESERKFRFLSEEKQHKKERSSMKVESSFQPIEPIKDKIHSQSLLQDTYHKTNNWVKNKIKTANQIKNGKQANINKLESIQDTSNESEIEQQSVDGLRKQVQDLKSEIKKVSQKYYEKVEQEKKIKNQLCLIESRHKSQKQKLQKQKQQLHQASGKLKQSDQTIQQFQNQMQLLNHQIKQHLTQIEKIKLQNKQMQQTLLRKDKQLQDFATKSSEQLKQYEANSVMKKEREEKQDGVSVNESFDKKQKIKDEQILVIKKEMNEKTDLLNKSIVQAANIKKQIDQIADENKLSKSNFSILQAQNISLTSTIEKLHVQIEQLNRQKQDLLQKVLKYEANVFCNGQGSGEIQGEPYTQSQCLNQSKQLSIMQAEIINFKDQLNELLQTLEQKDQQIQSLNNQLINNFQNGVHVPENTKLVSSEMSSNLSQVERLSIMIMEQERQLQDMKVQNTKHEFLTNKIGQLESLLEKEKEIYQSEIMKNNVKIFDLENQIRKLNEPQPLKKRKVSSSQYFSLEPPNTNKEEQKHSKIIKFCKKMPTQDNQSELYHSFEDEADDQKKSKKQNEKEGTRSRLRREKSQQEVRKNLQPGLKLHKLSSIQRCDSDDENKNEKGTNFIVNHQMRSSQHGLSPNAISQSELKLSICQKINKEKQIKQSPANITSHDQIPHATYSSNSILNNEQFRTLSDENKQLRHSNEKLSKDIKYLSQLVSNFQKRWKNLKNSENNSQIGKLISVDQLQEQIRVLNLSKVRLLQEFNTGDLQTIFDSLTHLVGETKRWVDMMEILSKQNKRITMEMIIYKNYPKLIKTKTLKINYEDDPDVRERSVYSEGNVATQRHIIDVDFSPFQLHEELHQQHAQNTNGNMAINSLQILFKQNNEMSEISSVKHNSFNSGFLNSKSQIAKIFEKGEKYEKQMKEKEGRKDKEKEKDENKKDIVDEYIMMNINNKKPNNISISQNPNYNSNKKLSSNNISNSHRIYNSRTNSGFLNSNPNMHKHSQIYLETSNFGLQKKFQEKSTKTKRKILNKTISRLSAINAKLCEERKQFVNIVNSIIKKYEQKMKFMNKQFSYAMRKVMENSITIQQSKELIRKENVKIEKPIPIQTPKSTLKVEIPPLVKVPSNTNRISQKDEQTEQRIEQLQNLVEKQKVSLETKQKLLNENKQQIKDLEKKLKEEKANNQSLKSKFLSESATSEHLKKRIQKMNKDFSSFLATIMKRPLSIIKEQIPINDLAMEKRTLQKPQQEQVLLKKQPIQKADLKIFTKKSNESLLSETIPYERPTSPFNQPSQKLQNKIMKKNLEKTSNEGKNQNDNIMEQENKEQKMEDLRISRVKSHDEAPKKQKERFSDKTPSDGGGKSINFGDLINSFLSPNTISKKVTIEQASEGDKIIYYQSKLKQINVKLQSLVQSHFGNNIKMQLQNSSESFDKAFKNKKERQSKSKNSQDLTETEKPKKEQKRDQNQVLDNLKLLETDLINSKEETVKRANEKEQRLKDIFGEIISLFRISKKSVDRIIDIKQKKDNSTVKYLHARAFIKNVYQRLKTKQTTKPDKKQKVSKSTSIQSGLQEPLPSQQLADSCNYQQFQSFQDKLAQLMKQNEKLKDEIKQKGVMLEDCNKKMADSNILQQELRRQISRFSERRSNGNEKFEQFSIKEIFDNTKPTQDLIDELRRQNEIYKAKCLQYEGKSGKKVGDKKHVFIRKW